MEALQLKQLRAYRAVLAGKRGYGFSIGKLNESGEVMKHFNEVIFYVLSFIPITFLTVYCFTPNEVCSVNGKWQTIFLVLEVVTTSFFIRI